ncbi:MAG: hypothetical protein ACWA5T_03515 [Parvularcula sp.]
MGAALSAGLSGCVAPGGWMKGPDDPVYVLVTSDPADATVSFTDGTSCETPCRLGIVDPVEMTVARIGYEPKILRVDRQTPTPLKLTLTPVGRSTAVEEVELPDL